MAVNETRNLSRDLREGLTDGSVKKMSPDRGGNVENVNRGEHVGLDGRTYCYETLQEQYGAFTSHPVMEDMADRLHDGKIVPEPALPEHTWYEADVPRNRQIPLPGGVDTPS